MTWATATPRVLLPGPLALYAPIYLAKALNLRQAWQGVALEYPRPEWARRIARQSSSRYSDPVLDELLDQATDPALLAFCDPMRTELLPTTAANQAAYARPMVLGPVVSKLCYWLNDGNASSQGASYADIVPKMTRLVVHPRGTTGFALALNVLKECYGATIPLGQLFPIPEVGREAYYHRMFPARLANRVAYFTPDPRAVLQSTSHTGELWSFLERGWRLAGHAEPSGKYIMSAAVAADVTLLKHRDWIEDLYQSVLDAAALIVKSTNLDSVAAFLVRSGVVPQLSNASILAACLKEYKTKQVYSQTGDTISNADWVAMRDFWAAYREHIALGTNQSGSSVTGNPGSASGGSKGRNGRGAAGRVRYRPRDSRIALVAKRIDEGVVGWMQGQGHVAQPAGESALPALAFQVIVGAVGGALVLLSYHLSATASPWVQAGPGRGIVQGVVWVVGLLLLALPTIVLWLRAKQTADRRVVPAVVALVLGSFVLALLIAERSKAMVAAVVSDADLGANLRATAVTGVAFAMVTVAWRLIAGRSRQGSISEHLGRWWRRIRLHAAVLWEAYVRPSRFQRGRSVRGGAHG